MNSLKLVDTSNVEDESAVVLTEPVEITAEMRKIGFDLFNKFVTEINAGINFKVTNDQNYFDYKVTVKKNEEPFLNAAVGKFKEIGYFVIPSEPSISPKGDAKIFNISFVW